MKKNFILILSFLLVSIATFAGKFILIPVTETNHLESLFNNNDLKIHYYNDAYVLATADVVHYGNAVVLDEHAFDNVDSYMIVYCYEDMKEEYISKLPKSDQILFSGDHFMIMKILSNSFMPAKNDGMVVVMNKEAKLPKSTFDFPVIAEPEEIILSLLEEVSQEGLIATVQTMQDFQTRNCVHNNSILAQNWIKEQYENLGLEVSFHTFSNVYPWWGGQCVSDNVIAIQYGTEFPDEYIVCGCHFDSFTSASTAVGPGADDNATGVAGILETAKILSQYDFKRSIIYCSFTAEECGLYGSGYYAQDCASESMNIIGYFNIDMSGYLQPGSNMHIDLIHPNSAISLANYYINVANIYFPTLPVTSYPNLPGGDSDHTSFNQNGYMGIFPFEDRNNHSPYIHTNNDIIGTSVNNPEQVKVFTQVNIASIATLALFEETAFASPTNCIAQYFEENKIKVTWDAPAFDSPSQYYIFRDETPIAQCEVAITNYIDEVDDYQEYCYKITAVYEDQQQSAPSNPSCAAVPAPLLPPINCVAQYIDDETIQITWLPNSETHTIPDKYYVYKDETQIDETEEYSYLDAVSDYDLHCYKITAIYNIADESLESDFSNVDCDSVPFINSIFEHYSNFKIYPNPTKGELAIEYALFDDQMPEIQIYDTFGRIKKMKSKPSKSKPSEITINISHLPAGVYIVKIAHEFIGKFIKE